MTLFSVTGFTLNHAGRVEAKPSVLSQHAEIKGALQATLASQTAAHYRASTRRGKPPIPAVL